MQKDTKHWDLGDVVGVRGTLCKSGMGDLYVMMDEYLLLTKSLRPLPEKHKGLTDTESRYRQRYVDLIVNEDSRRTFQIRSQMVAGIRNYLVRHGFVEAETPMLQVIPGGATARPFITHHNSLDLDMYLRIAPELYLKRLVVGGFERVFEINRNFRNEGLSTRHNPEFTMLEFYQAYADHNDLMNLTEDMLRTLAQDVLGTTEIPYQDDVYDFGKPFARLSVFDSILQYNDDIDAATPGGRAGRPRHRRTAGHRREGTAGAWARCRSRSSRRPSSTASRTPLSSPITPPRCRRWPAARTTTPSSPSASSSSSAAARSPTASPSSTTPRIKRNDFAPRWPKKKRGTTKPCSMTKTTSPPWNTACRPPPARESASTVW